jgi:NhaA family Na+:H+ antiporter
VTTFCWLAVKTGVATLPAATGWGQIIGTSLLAGIGFTVTLFIADLSYQDPALITDAKIAILLASLLAGVTGFLFLKFTTVSQTAAREVS